MDDDTTSGAPDGAGGTTPPGPLRPVEPEWIGRYRVARPIGRGGFGLVYLARDEQLQRPVAVKVPHRHRLAAPEDAAACLAEARMAAGLDHPNIVPVYDVGSTEEYPCFIVSKYIEGVPLSARIAAARPSAVESACLAATVAEALHHAHRARLVHRDVKPENILIDAAGTPFVVDFGVALKEESTGKRFRHAGTPAYMSPEQARGEGHRVDARSDVFSLGVVFYEMLTGRRPFNGDSQAELLEQVRSFDPRPPRQHDDGIPKELERICMKALAKRASERYATAGDLAEDLRHWTGNRSGGGGAGGAKGRPAAIEAGLPRGPGAGKDIFLSHASPDKETADRLCQLIEERGVGCWIAPRDVAPGDDYAEAIIRAIEETSVTVLLLSAHSNSSIHVKNEIERATSKGRRVVPVRLEDIAPDRSLELHLSRTQWVDAARLGLEQVAAQLVGVVRGERGKAAAPSRPAPSAAAPSAPSTRLHVVPKGLRSFDARDADFFLELVPGPRDREGLPDSIRFWKSRIEETDADDTFAVGLIYGPSGCGKSSLVKAGLLPRLSDAVVAVYVEATAGETESRLLTGLRKRCPNLDAGLDLTGTLAALRRGQGVPYGKKVLIVLDQFEQWLHARKDEQNTELVGALRQCDGGRVQCIVMVRDDFWLAVSRFLRELEVRLLEGHNSALADLFDRDHARKVLAAFGRAFGKLPEAPSEVADDARRFLSQAVSGLAQEGKVISVRLALFAEMMKGKPWTPKALKEVGGAEGVGVTFLEETFSAASAPPEHRYHQKAARAVLKCLLPESGTDIKGHMRSRAELLEASGYAGRPRDFDDLIAILDGEVRLLTPTDPEGKEAAEAPEAPGAPAQFPSPGTPGEGRVRVFSPGLGPGGAPPPVNPASPHKPGAQRSGAPDPSPDSHAPDQPSGAPLRCAPGLSAPTGPSPGTPGAEENPSPHPSPGVPGEGENTRSPDGPESRYYQLTHDYLVPSMRDWLTRKQKETRRGRAELLLADRAGVWISRPENRQLPSLPQWLSIRWLTRKKAWTAPQRKMMGRAGRRHATRAGALIVLLAAAVVAGLAVRSNVVEGERATRADGLVRKLIAADASQVPEALKELTAYRRWADPLLRQQNAAAASDSRERLRTSLALLPVDAGQVDYLYGRLLTADPNEVPVIRDALLPHRLALLERLWAVVEKPEKGKEPTRLRAAAALAAYDPEGVRWARCGPLVVNDLVEQSPVFFGQWSQAFLPVKDRLLPALSAVFRDPRPERSAERNLATNLLADYAAGQPDVLADLLMDSDEKQFAVLFPKFAAQAEKGLPILIAEMGRKLPATMPSSDPARETLGKRQANAAVALLRLNQPDKVWPDLRHTPDPRARSYLIHRLGPLGADPAAIIARLDVEQDVSIRRALVLSLGEFGDQAIAPEQRKSLIAKMQGLYRADPDPGLHAAVEWLLGTWKQGAWLAEVNEQWAMDDDHRSGKLKALAAATQPTAPATQQWYVNTQGQTMIAIPGPVEFTMGSPAAEAGREKDEVQHKVRIGRTFAIAAKAVTFEQYRKFYPTYKLSWELYTRMPNLPVVATSWYEAAAYCNWLSRQEGIPEDQWCYIMDFEGTKVSALKLKYLSLDGYRLPTEAEIEYATRAGAVTSRYYGETDELLPKYAWFNKNSEENTWPVGSRKPNDLGFFDLHGNVWCWCQEAYANYPVTGKDEVAEDKEGDLNVISTSGRVLRGSSFVNPSSVVRSACRNGYVPTNHGGLDGFRPARTLRPAPLTSLPPPP